MTDHPLRERLVAGAPALGVSLSDTQFQQLLDFLGLLGKWNKVYNLTAVRDPEEMLTHHLLDSLAVIAPLRRHTLGRAVRLLDVGSGGGLPGVVIAICCPEIAVTCVDAVAKKAAFIQQVAGALALSNLSALHARVESLTTPFDVITSRAFATLHDFTAWSLSALSRDGVWMAMKGRHPADELRALPGSIQHVLSEALHVPGLTAERCVVWLKPADSLVSRPMR